MMKKMTEDEHEKVERADDSLLKAFCITIIKHLIAS